MSTGFNSRNIKIIILWSMIIILSCVIYFTGISHESFWYDEAFSSSMTNHNFFDIISKTAYDNHPPLYYLLLKIFKDIFGNSEWALRLLSVIGAVATVSLGAGPVRRIFGNRTAVIYAIVVMFIPGILIYAHEARMYSLAIFAVTAGALYGYIAAKENRIADWIRFGIVTLAAAYLHYYALIAAFFMHLAIFVWLVTKNRKHLKSCIITGILVLAAYLPWVFFFIKQIKDVKSGFFIQLVSLTEIYLALNKPFIYRDIFPAITIFMSLALLLLIILIICGFVFSRLKKLEKEKEFGIFSLTVYLGTFILPIILSLVLTPVFYNRYVIVCAGLLAILASIGIATLPVKFLQPVTLIIFAAMNVFTIKDIYLEKFNHPMRALYLNMKNEIKPGDLIVVSDSYSMGPAMYYFPQTVFYYSVNSIEAKWKHVLIPLSPPLNFDDDPKDLFKTHDSFWYITCNTGLSKSVWTILKNEKGWMENTKPKTYSEKYCYVSFTIQQFVKTDNKKAITRGTLKFHITGLRKTGAFFVLIYNKKGGFLKNETPYRYEYINVSGNKMDYSIDGLEYGEYAVVIAHDENGNFTFESDKDGSPIEGIFIMNSNKLGKMAPLEDFTFEKLKFNFNQPEMTVNAKMSYPLLK